MTAAETIEMEAAREKSASPTKGRRWLRRLGVLAGVLMVVLVAGELYARYRLGLGDPPLSMEDPDVEYRFRPNQDCRRFGNRIIYNEYSMRSESFPKVKGDGKELRVLVVGDSVVNGGSLTAHEDLATTRLQKVLEKDLGRKVVVGNISAGSWGPPNMEAYLKKFGWFEADALVLVVSSHDIGDVMTFAKVVGVNPDFPERRPFLALTEGMTRYLPRYMPSFGKAAALPPATRARRTLEFGSREVNKCLSAFMEILETAKAKKMGVFVSLHFTRLEFEEKMMPESHVLFSEAAERAGANVIWMNGKFGECSERGTQPYRDDIHPSVGGQAAMAEAWTGPLEKYLRKRMEEGVGMGSGK